MSVLAIGRGPPRAPQSSNMNDRELKAKQYLHENCFDENSPRPPVPGEERAHCVSEWDAGRHKQQFHLPCKSYYANGKTTLFKTICQNCLKIHPLTLVLLLLLYLRPFRYSIVWQSIMTKVISYKSFLGTLTQFFTTLTKDTEFCPVPKICLKSFITKQTHAVRG